MKKIIASLLVLLCVFSVACGEEAAKQKVLSVTVDELLEVLTTSNAEGEMYSYNSSRLADNIGISEDLYSAGKFFIPVESAGVETIAFFTATSEENAEKIKASLEGYISRIKNEQENYSASNFEVAKSAVAVKEGLNVYLIMSPSKDALISLINTYLK